MGLTGARARDLEHRPARSVIHDPTSPSVDRLPTHLAAVCLSSEAGDLGNASEAWGRLSRAALGAGFGNLSVSINSAFVL